MFNLYYLYNIVIVKYSPSYRNSACPLGSLNRRLHGAGVYLLAWTYDKSVWYSKSRTFKLRRIKVELLERKEKN